VIIIPVSVPGKASPVYRCNLNTRDRTLPVSHVARVAAPIDEFIRKLVIARMSRDDAATLIAVPDNGIDVTAPWA